MSIKIIIGYRPIIVLFHLLTWEWRLAKQLGRLLTSLVRPATSHNTTLHNGAQPNSFISLPTLSFMCISQLSTMILCRYPFLRDRVRQVI